MKSKLQIASCMGCFTTALHMPSDVKLACLKEHFQIACTVQRGGTFLFPSHVFLLGKGLNYCSPA